MKRIPVGELAQNVLKLPRLPLPSLADTALRYKATLKPLRSGEAAAQHLARLDAFLESSAPVLQKSLVELDQAAITTGTYPFSYIEKLEDLTYLRSRTPLEVNVNPGFVLKRGIRGTDQTQTGVAAGIVHGIATWLERAIESGVEVRDAALDISPLVSEFGRCLTPGKEEDTIHTTPLQALRHVVVLHDGHAYTVQVLDDQHKALDRAVIQKAFELLLSITPDEDNTTSISVLTAASRTLWGEAYQELLKMPENVEPLRLIREGILVVCLDSNAWDAQSALHSTLHGGKAEMENRWYDKHQLIVSADGQAAFNLEPSRGECTHWARWIDDVLRNVAAHPDTAVSTASVQGEVMNTVLRHIHITFGKSFAGHVQNARHEALGIVNGTEVRSVNIPYGRKALQAVGVDPDTFAQTCLQLAMYATRDRLSPASQLCSAAHFFHGGVEVARTASEEMLALATELSAAYNKVATPSTEGSAPAAPQISSTTMEKLQQLIHANSKKLKELTARTSAGEGIDRHLMALHSVAVNNGDKAGLAFFNDDVYKSTSTFLLDTCAHSEPWLQNAVFGPSNKNGYGLGYVVDENEIRISLSAFSNSPSTDVSDFKPGILESATKLMHILGGSPSQK